MFAPNTQARRVRLSLGLITALWFPASAAAVDFDTHVAPILEQHCVRCHGEATQKSELNFATLAGLLRGGESGVVVVPGNPTSSRLVEVLRDNEMPPEDEGEPLPNEEIEVIVRWIAEFPSEGTERKLNQHDVLPIFLAKCAECHGRQVQEGKLDIRSRKSLLAGGKSGPALVPGDPHASLLLQRIHKGEMPPREKLAKYSVKPVTKAEQQRIHQWILQGASWIDTSPDAPSTKDDPLVSDEDRNHWAYRPPRRVAPPRVSGAVANPIDAFVISKLQERDLKPSPRARPATLLRRLTMDLTGLPPEIDQVRKLTDGAIAYEQLVDALLASPAYGERWGQYWLDVAGYADSEGVQHADPVRPHAYRYRDYVIRSFNDDKPYDRFLSEQLAGDELADYENAEVITQELYDNLVATGFLRMSSDGTFAGITGFLPNRLDVIDDQIRILSASVMGLTIRCARCHSHKFDAIPQRDYYRLAAIFKGAMDEFDWLRPIPGTVGKPRYLPHVTTSERNAWKRHEESINRQVAELNAKKKQLGETPEGKQAKQSESIDEQRKRLEAKRRAEPMIRALWDHGEPSPTYLLVRGDYQQPGRVVGPGVPSVLTDGRTPFTPALPWPGAKKTGNRLAFAQWLTRNDHPLTARVIVNRIWKHHFGRGLVEPVDDFGKAGGTPSHPDLLDWLAVEFVEHEFSMKWLHRLIVTSNTYQQSSQVSPRHLAHDSDNFWLSRMPLRRMEAEVLRDSLLWIAGKLRRNAFGPADPVEARADGLVTSQPLHGSWRRSIYVQKRRTERLTILDNFDRPRMSPNCVVRNVSNVAPQALHLMNNAMIRELSKKMAERIRRQVGNNRNRQLDQLYLLALSRHPSTEERDTMLEFMAKIETAWGQASSAEDPLANACHAIINSAAFLYID